MRIAYVITRSDAVGGASIHVRDLAREMMARGHQAEVFLGGVGPVTDQLEQAGVPYRPLSFLRRAVHPILDWKAFRELSNALAEFRPDIVSTHTAKAGWIGRAVCARLGIPAVYTPHGWPAGDRFPPLKRQVFAAAERIAARQARVIVCVCEHEKQVAIDKRLARPEQLVVVYNGVRDVGPELRAVAGAVPVRLISVARLDHPKDHATLIDALSRLANLDWRLDLVGDGPLRHSIHARAQAARIADRIRFLGYSADPAALLARSQIFVLSSRAEAFPRSVLEAMRAGLAIIASDVGGVGEALDNGSNGILVPRRDPIALSNALGELIEDADRRRRLGTAARLTYEVRFRLDAMIERTAAVYESVLRNAAR
ncbi:MAG: glycosyltransferase family 4 protein [Bryobacteraceae bacterium]